MAVVENWSCSADIKPLPKKSVADSLTKKQQDLIDLKEITVRVIEKQNENTTKLTDDDILVGSESVKLTLTLSLAIT